MVRCLWTLLFLLFLGSPAAARVELAVAGKPPVVLEEVYLRDGLAFLAIDDVLPALRLSGWWDSVAHTYRIKTPLGTALISPGSRYLRLKDQFIPLEPSPRFIDGRLRVSEDFVTGPLASLLDTRIFYRNLDPAAASVVVDDQTPLDRLFAFLLRKKRPANAQALRGVAIDPGHGGQDVGCLGVGGVKEKDVTLALAQRLEKLLKMRLGIPIYLSRDSDYVVSRDQRLAPANQPEVDVWLQLHAQASFSPQAAGIDLFVRPAEAMEAQGPADGSGESWRLARSLKSALEVAGFTVGTVAEAPLLTLERGDLPTVLIELGYLSNAIDALRLQDPAEQQRLAVALFSGLKQFAETTKETE